ncbi:hypothetical protein [Elizabethkingia anophelis]|uniref:Restriction endonuclease n=1 Tax=Elizabethkingia anophelis TaxID=1117645 RepID=A0AAU8UV76_9FLAO|nr:hypothetical protein [Elizabethkingia anophelis]AQX01821.1 hypothetical protein BBD32_10275 [Elizabethkingia anophelis]MYY48398.1 hypothetical protein [Elizabethkingia anophelis]OPB63119.1 hypothetical protein BAY11_04160 [Elizabethkingia anophelis]
MKKISINNIIKFRLKSDKSQKGFLNSISKDIEIKAEGGGNYWVRSISAMNNAIRTNSNEPIKDKITELLDLFVPSLTKQTKDMYQRNLNILHNYEDFDFSKWLPKNYTIISKTNKKSIIYIETIPVQITPSQIYSFEKEGKKYVGAIWFVAKLDGYNITELGIFAEALFIYLSNNFDQNFTINPENCLIVDVIGEQEVNYKELIDEKISAILKPTLELIKKLR